jgi:hypothetical protein
MKLVDSKTRVICHRNRDLSGRSFSASGHFSEGVAMRVLLTDSKTGKYLVRRGRWTRNSSKAQNFHTGWGATDYAFSISRPQLAIVYEFEDRRYNFKVPVARTSGVIGQQQPRSKRQLGRRSGQGNRLPVH